MRQIMIHLTGILFSLLIALGLMTGMSRTAYAYGSEGEDCLTFTGEEAFTLSTGNNSRIWDGTMEYSTDKSTWTDWNGERALSSSNTNPYVLYLRGKNNTQVGGEYGKCLVLSNRAACSGNIMTLLDYEVPPTIITKDKAFSCLFNKCINLTSAPSLPAKTLTKECYSSMFSGCTGLTGVPYLPAKTLAYKCYAYMFQGCTGLTKVPSLPATTLAEECYAYMFQGCTGLTSAPSIADTTLTKNCCEAMFKDCTGLTSVPSLPATILAEGCYLAMFMNCTGLTSAPSLPATILAESCYAFMFQDCTGLTSAPSLPATILADHCYLAMFQGCTGLTSVPPLPATTLTEECYAKMFLKCTGILVSDKKGIFDDIDYILPFRIPVTGTATCTSDHFSARMFEDTGGRFVDDPQINTTYYIAHTHDFTYSDDGETITATCRKTDCHLTDRRVTLKIKAPLHMSYDDGKEAEARLDGLEEFNYETGKTITSTDIRYVGRDGTAYPESTTAPIAGGRYTARITVEGKTAGVDYEIVVPVVCVSLNSSTTQTVEVGKIVSFMAIVSPDNATDKKVKWGVGGTNPDAVVLYSDPECTSEIGPEATEILTIYAKGVSVGSATVIVTSNVNETKKASCGVTVNPATYKVTYRIVNGMWSDDSTEDKTETVQSGSKPAGVPYGMKASEGYTGGAWDRNPADAVITGETTFTYTFTKPGKGGGDPDNPQIPESPEDKDARRVPLLDGQIYASSKDNFGVGAAVNHIGKLTLDFTNVEKSPVKPSNLIMTVIAGSKLTTAAALKDSDSFSDAGGVKVKVNKDTLKATIICKTNGNATLTMEDGITYTIAFTVDKPKAVKSAKKMAAGSDKAVKTIKDLFGTDIDNGELTVVNEKVSGQATLSGNKLVISPAEKDTVKLQYRFLNKKYKMNIKVK